MIAVEFGRFIAASGQLVLGGNILRNNTILANELSVGRDLNNGTVTIRNGGVLNLGSSAAQSVILMAVVILLTMLQFKIAEKKVTY